MPRDMSTLAAVVRAGLLRLVTPHDPIYLRVMLIVLNVWRWVYYIYA